MILVMNSYMVMIGTGCFSDAHTYGDDDVDGHGDGDGDDEGDDYGDVLEYDNDSNGGCFNGVYTYDHIDGDGEGDDYR